MGIFRLANDEPLQMWLMGYVDYIDQLIGPIVEDFADTLDPKTCDLTFDEASGVLNDDRPLSKQERQQLSSIGERERQPYRETPACRLSLQAFPVS